MAKARVLSREEFDAALLRVPDRYSDDDERYVERWGHDKGYLVRRDRALLAAMYAYGKRVTEVLGVTLRDLNLRDGMLFITFRILKRKDNFSQAIPVKADNLLVKLILDHVDAVKVLGEEKLFSLTRQSAWLIVHQAFQGGHPHELRHTRLTRISEVTTSFAQIKEAGGWKSDGSAQTYLHASGKNLEALADKVE